MPSIDRIPGQQTRPRRAQAGLGSDFLPYEGAIKDVDLGSHDLITTGVISAGSFVATGNITGNGYYFNTTRVTSSPYTTLATDDEIFVDTDGGAVLVNLMPGLDGKRYRIINVGSADNDVTIAPDGVELLTGANASRTLSDGSVVILSYEPTEGWW